MFLPSRCVAVKESYVVVHIKWTDGKRTGDGVVMLNEVFRYHVRIYEMAVQEPYSLIDHSTTHIYTWSNFINSEWLLWIHKTVDHLLSHHLILV